MTKGEGGQKSQKIDDVFYERPHVLPHWNRLGKKNSLIRKVFEKYVFVF